MDEVLVSKTDDESLYYKLNPKNPSLDGRVDRDGESMDVPFWSYAAKAEVKPITTTKFHKALWNGSPSDEEWAKKFWSRETPFSDEELDSLKDPLKYTGGMTEARRVDLRGSTTKVKAATPPNSSTIENLVSLVPGGPDVQGRANARLHGQRGNRGNLATLLRWWRPRMLMEGGFRRCLVTLADHPELYPLENICAWLHHTTTGLWPNEGCHHPGMKNCRRKARRMANGKPKPIVRASVFSDSEFARRVRALTGKKKTAQSAPHHGNQVAFKALAYATATGTKVRLKSGLVSSHNSGVRALESIASYAIPGDMSRVRNPGRSTLYRAVTPGGGRDRIGRPQMYRCPVGFAHGGSFTDRRFSTCGPRVFADPGAVDNVVGAARAAAGDAARGLRAAIVNADKPLTGQRVAPGEYVAESIARAANVAKIGKESRRQVMSSIENAASLVYEDQTKFGKLVRRDGSVMDLTMPLDKLSTIKNMDDLKNGFIISRVADPANMGQAELPTLRTGLRGFVLALPNNSHITVEKMPKATGASVEGMIRKFNSLSSSESPLAFGSALAELVDKSNGNLGVAYHMPNIKNPNQVIQVQREGAMRSVVRWVYELFLSETAPARNKASKPWVMVTESNRNA